CREFLNYLKPRIAEYHALLTTNHIFVQRTGGIGMLSKELALSHGCSGPMLRGSLDRRKGDPDWDLRKLEPYCGYESYTFNAAAAAGRRGVPGDGVPAGPDGLLRGRQAVEGPGAAAGAGPVVELLEPERDGRGLPQLPDRGRAGHCRQHRHRHGRDRSLEAVS